MHSVFVAGSRALSRLTPQIKERLDNIMAKEFVILVGDANGADKAVQQYVAQEHYESVIVYCMEVCRNNVGAWPVRSHSAAPSSKRDRFYYGVKDAAMVRDATWGFMLWDGRSKGTLTDAIGLLSADKKVLLYLSSTKEFVNLHTFGDLRNVVDANGLEEAVQFLRSQTIDKPETRHLPFRLDRLPPDAARH